MLNELMDRLRGSTPRENPNVVATIRLRKAYTQYVIESQQNGETPLPFEEWAKGK